MSKKNPFGLVRFKGIFLYRNDYKEGKPMVYYLHLYGKKEIMVKVQCVLCDKLENIDDMSPLAKKLRNRPIHTYMCKECYDRISERTLARINSGNFKLYRPHQSEDDWW